MLKQNSDSLGLLKAIKDTTFKFQGKTFVFDALYDSSVRAALCKQGKHMTTQEYMEMFQNVVDVIEHSGGSIGYAPAGDTFIAKEKNINITTATPEQLLLMANGSNQWGTIIPKDSPDRDRIGMQGASNDGIAFTHLNSVEEEDDETYYANKCPNEKFIATSTQLFMSGTGEQSVTQLLMSSIDNGDFDASERSSSGFSIHISDEPAKLLHTAVTLLQSTVDIFHNVKLLVNIRPSKTSMDIHCNAGVTSTNLIGGDLPGYGTVCYHPKGIADILSLSKVKNHGNHVTHDSDDRNEFRVHKPDGEVRVFSESKCGLYFMDASASETENLFVNTVERIARRDYSQAVLARKIQKTIGHPSTRTFINIVENKLLKNCPITTRDIKIAEEIFGPDVGILKGKTVRRSTERVVIGTVDIPLSIMTHYRDIVLGGDILFVNKLPFL
eukprot:scaffold9975_cov51-Attheya_sp.AAC.2